MKELLDTCFDLWATNGSLRCDSNADAAHRKWRSSLRINRSWRCWVQTGVGPTGGLTAEGLPGKTRLIYSSLMSPRVWVDLWRCTPWDEWIPVPRFVIAYISWSELINRVTALLVCDTLYSIIIYASCMGSFTSHSIWHSQFKTLNILHRIFLH